MQPLALTITIVGVLATQAAATIAFGTQGSYKVAWISGDNPCGNTVQVSPSNQIPCDRKFKLRNGFTYELRDCGTPSFALWNGDGSYNHVANSKSKNLGCDGVADVHQEWQF